MKRVVLDTDTCSYLIREKPQVVLLAMQRHVAGGGALEISSISYSELRLGAERSGNPAKHHRLIDDFCGRLTILPWDAACADHFARLQAALLAQGTPIGGNDAMIAAHALAVDATLVSNNTRHFGKVPNLRLENWAQSL